MSIPAPPNVAGATGSPLEPEFSQLLADLVRIAPTNLEDPVHGRFEKPRYREAADRIAALARLMGFTTRIFDPAYDGPPNPALRGISRPNLIIDLDADAAETVLVLTHYDVVPVPAEQLSRWKTPPHTLTARPDGRWYGRGSNDDLGSGVLSSLIAMKQLERDRPRRNVRLIVACDEETGGEGGIESLKTSDAHLDATDARRYLLADVALIPDGDSHATAGSSGVVFLDATFTGPVPLLMAVRYGEFLVSTHETTQLWKSIYRSPDWPDHGAPEEFITGRATVTKFDFAAPRALTGGVQLTAAHAETDAANQIAEAVTLVFEGTPDRLADLPSQLIDQVGAPFHLRPAQATALRVPPGALAMQVVGQSAHGGYPHRGHNPVVATLALLKSAASDGRVDPTPPGTASFAVDLRLIPEMPLEVGRSAYLSRVQQWIAASMPAARLDSPPGRARGGYSLPPDHPDVVRLEKILHRTFGVSGVFGEYGGTDASTLSEVRTREGEPLPALVFGCIDRQAHAHEAEESVDPTSILRVAETIYRFVQEP